MATLESRISLIKPDLADSVDITMINSNMDRIAYCLGFNMCTSTTRPNGGQLYDGMPIYEKDTTLRYLYRLDTATWVAI